MKKLIPMKCSLVILVFCFFAGNAHVYAQKKKAQSPKSSNESSQTEVTKLADQLVKSRAGLVDAAKEYRTSLEKLLALVENDVKLAAEAVEKRKELYARSVISRRELEEGEQALMDVQRKAEQTRKETAETDDLIAGR